MLGDFESWSFLQSCLLLLLRERPAEDQDLVERVRLICDETDNSASVYRLLRGLERRGLVRSYWQPASPIGPARRHYRITAKGLVSLAQRTEALTSAHREMHAFLERYAESAPDEPVLNGFAVARNGTTGWSSSGH